MGGRELHTRQLPGVSVTACLIKVIRMKGIVNIDRESIKPRKEMVVQIPALSSCGDFSGIMSLSFVFVQS